jgi:hypothetical protein
MECLIGLQNVVKRNSAAFPLQSGRDFVKLSALRTIIRREARQISKIARERYQVGPAVTGGLRAMTSQ